MAQGSFPSKAEDQSHAWRLLCQLRPVWPSATSKPFHGGGGHSCQVGCPRITRPAWRPGAVLLVWCQMSIAASHRWHWLARRLGSLRTKALGGLRTCRGQVRRCHFGRQRTQNLRPIATLPQRLADPLHSAVPTHACTPPSSPNLPKTSGRLTSATRTPEQFDHRRDREQLGVAHLHQQTPPSCQITWVHFPCRVEVGSAIQVFYTRLDQRSEFFGHRLHLSQSTGPLGFALLFRPNLDVHTPRTK